MDQRREAHELPLSEIDEDDRSRRIGPERSGDLRRLTVGQVGDRQRLAPGPTRERRRIDVVAVGNQDARHRFLPPKVKSDLVYGGILHHANDHQIAPRRQAMARIGQPDGLAELQGEGSVFSTTRNATRPEPKRESRRLASAEADAASVRSVVTTASSLSG